MAAMNRNYLLISNLGLRQIVNSSSCANIVPLLPQVVNSLNVFIECDQP